MLRRRRSNINSSPLESTVDRVRKTREDGILKAKSNKLKMSPFPEVRGVSLKENRRIHRLSEVKQSLLFEAEEASSALSSPAFFRSRPTSPGSERESDVGHEEQANVVGSQTTSKRQVRPSDIVELEKQVTPRSLGRLDESGVRMSGIEAHQSPEQPTVAIRSMWDNVVSWMKKAVDLVTYDEPLDAEPMQDDVSLGKKRPLADANVSLPEAKLPRVSDKTRRGEGEGGSSGAVGGKRRDGLGGRSKRRRDGKRMSTFEGLRTTARRNAESSNQDGLGQLLTLELITEKKEKIESSSLIKQTTPIPPPTFFSNHSEPTDHTSTPTSLKSPTNSLAKKFSNFFMKSPPTSISPQNQEVKVTPKKRRSFAKSKGSSKSLDSTTTTLLMMEEAGDGEAASKSPGKSKRRRSVMKSKGSDSALVVNRIQSEDADSATSHANPPPVKSKRRKSLSKLKGSSLSLGHEPSKTEGGSSTVADGIDETDSAIPPMSAQPFKKAPMRFSASNPLVRSLHAHQSRNEGLNSLLDGSPVPGGGVVGGVSGFGFKKRIKRESLREFYGNSVNSPNLTEVPSAVITVRRSPRLADNQTSQLAKSAPPPPPAITTVTHTPSTPIPPPPPPIPTSHIPQAPPTPGAWQSKEEQSENTTTKPMNHSRGVLQKMQHRLRSRMKKKGEGQSESDGPASASKVDGRVLQWAEIQAMSRKITVSEFLELAREKKMELKNTLESLQSEVPNTMKSITAVVEQLHEASQWFASGSKEMREAMPAYKSLEKKIEVLNEFVQVCSEMRKVCSPTLSSDQLPQDDPIHYSDLHKTLALIKEDFESKHRHWDSIISSNAESWVQLGLPVPYKLLSTARLHLCGLVKRFINLTLHEASKINGILLTNKSPRTNQAKEKLRDCLNLLIKTHGYFTDGEEHAAKPGEESTKMEDSAMEEENESQETCLLQLIVKVAVVYIHISLEQFNGFVCKLGRQEVCETFEGVLKIISLVKTILTELHGRTKVLNSGIISLLSDAEDLGSAIYDSCVKLIRHIVSQAETFFSALTPQHKDKESKEIVLWMMFGCKYVNQTLEALGSEQADEKGVIALLDELQQMENLLPD